MFNPALPEALLNRDRIRPLGRALAGVSTKANGHQRRRSVLHGVSYFPAQKSQTQHAPPSRPADLLPRVRPSFMSGIAAAGFFRPLREVTARSLVYSLFAKLRFPQK